MMVVDVGVTWVGAKCLGLSGMSVGGKGAGERKFALMSNV